MYTAHRMRHILPSVPLLLPLRRAAERRPVNADILRHSMMITGKMSHNARSTHCGLTPTIRSLLSYECMLVWFVDTMESNGYTSLL